MSEILSLYSFSRLFVMSVSVLFLVSTGSNLAKPKMDPNEIPEYIDKTEEPAVKHLKCENKLMDPDEIPEYTDKTEEPVVKDLKCENKLMDPDEIPEFTDKSEKPAAKRFKNQNKVVKPLFKFKIKDLLEIPYDKSCDIFKFKSYNVSFIMCGGKVIDIFRDDSIFAFEVSDGTASIRCFHKFKHDPETWTKYLDRAPTRVEFCDRTFVPDETFANEETIFNPKMETTVVKKFQDTTTDDLNEVLFWFRNQVIDKQKVREIGDLIHVTGHLLEDETESIRKINVLDFRILDNELENQDLQLEIDYLHKFTYL